MGVPFDGRPVHICTGVTFVGVTNHVFYVAGHFAGNIPFKPGGESGTAAAPESGNFQFFDNLLGGHLKEGLFQSYIAFPGNIFIDAFRIDDTAVPQYHPQLFLVEFDILDSNLALISFTFLVQELLNFPALYNLFSNDGLSIFGLYFYIERIFRKNLNDRPLFTEPETTGLYNLNLILNTLFFCFSDQVTINLVTLVGFTSRTAADENIVVISHSFPLT